MKPVSLVFEAFGPYQQHTEIDFEALGSAALFLICGPTGGGKTSILDAMCFALYCRATGGRRDFKSMRCNTAEDQTPTTVDFCFALGGTQYRFERRLQMHTNRNTKEQKLQDKHACYKRENPLDEWSLMESGSESAVRKCAENLLHLTCEQFSQVIVLPQGEFLRFLRASSKEKGDMLKTLFSVQLWERITTNAAGRLKQLEADSRDQSAMRQSLLEREGLETTEALLEASRAAKESLSAGETENVRLAKEVDAAAKTLESARGYVRLKTELETRRTALDQAEKRHRAAALEMEGAGQNKTRQEQLRKEATELAQAAVKLAEQRERLKQAIEARQEAREKLAQAQMHAAQGKKVQAEVEKLEQRMKDGSVFLEQARKAAEELPALTLEQARLERALEARQELDKRLQTLEKLRELQGKLEKTFQEDTIVFESLAQKLKRQEAIRRHNAAYTLAQGLEPDAPCPVCGATTHPAPAQAGEQAMAEPDYQKLQETEKKADRKLQQTGARLERGRMDVKEAQEAVEQQTKLCGEEDQKTIGSQLEKLLCRLEGTRKSAKQVKPAQEKLDQLQKQREAGIGEKAKHMEAAASLTAAAAALEQPYKSEDLQDQQLRAKTLTEEITQKQTRRKLCEAQAEALSKRHEEALRRFSGTKADCEAAHKAAEKAASDFAIAKSAWEQPPVLAELEEAYKKLQESSRACSEKLGNTRSAVTSLEKTVSAVTELDGKLRVMAKRYEATAKLSRSLSGNNPLKTPILQYVLSIMLDEILVGANQFFDTLSRGRYALSRVTQQQGGTALRGLDIEVLDGNSMSARSIETLSGGEQFLASLSLAFGLSDTVQQHSGAVRLDALFIDEGFGSLDSETLDIAMRALLILQEGGRTVGIISHVSELRSRIPVRLEISRDNANRAVARLSGSNISVKTAIPERLGA